MSGPVLEIADVTFSYADRPAVLEKLNFRLREGDFVVVRGPSGAGKSTFLRLLCCLESPTAGEIRYRGTPVERFFAPELRRRVSYLQQVPVVLPATVIENLLVPFSLKSNRLEEPTRQMLRESLDRVGLGQVGLDASAEELSVGQRQRLCLIRTLLLEPDVLLLDEPLSALDAEAAGAVMRVLTAENRNGGVSVVMVGHGASCGLPGTRVVELKEASISEGGAPTWVP